MMLPTRQTTKMMTASATGSLQLALSILGSSWTLSRPTLEPVAISEQTV